MTKKFSFAYNRSVTVFENTQRRTIKMDLSQEHTKWNCRYHIVWAPKFRRKIIYGKYRKEIGAIIRKLCNFKDIEIVEANACIDHIHMCLRIPPKYSVAQIMGYLKGKSSLMIFEQFPNLKYKYGNRHFWCKGYYVSTVGVNEETIKKYIREQEDADKMTDNVKEPDNPF
jgi:putative transposase